LRAATGMDQAQCDEFMADFWVEYLGELNVELAEFVAALRPQVKIALLSNSFLGARARAGTLSLSGNDRPHHLLA
jgi:hypothetical protein